MKNIIIVLVVTLSIMFFSISIHNLAAQNVTTNASNATGNLTASNGFNATGNLTASNATGNLTASNATGNLTVFANQLTELGQKLSAGNNVMNMTAQTENSSFSQSGKNASNLEVEMLNKTAEAAK